MKKLLPSMNPQSSASAVFQTSIVFGTAAIGVVTAQAAVTTQTFNLTSSLVTQPIGIGYNYLTFALSNTGSQAGSVVGLSGMTTGKSGFSFSYVSGQSVSSPTGAQISSAPVSFGATIDSSLTWTDTKILSQGLGDTYYGIRFNEGGGNYNYGWLDLKTPGTDVIFVSAGVEQSINTAIGAGSVTSIPEPASTAVFAGLAGGAAAVVALRRRKQEA
jgi:hypothetical protein